MKTYLFYILVVVGIFSCACGCSNEDMEVEYPDLEDLIIDDNNVAEKWDGTGLPVWLRDRWFDTMLKELDWMIESYAAPTLYKIYKFYYQNNLLLVVTYDRFGFRQNYYHESGAICYMNDGRQVRLEKIKDIFEKNAELLWCNGFNGENIPQVADYNLEDSDSLGWLQEAIEQICNDIQEPERLLYKIACGYIHIDSDSYIVLDYEYFDKNNFSNGEIRVRNVYKPNGEKIIIPENLNIQELCSQLYSRKIIDILEYLSVGV